MIEWRGFDLEAQLYGGALAPDRGWISVPQGFGLGLEPDRDLIGAYAMV